MNNTASSDIFADYLEKYVISMTGYVYVCMLNKITSNNMCFKNLCNNVYLISLKRLY